VFDFLRTAASFDLIILDPPPFVRRRRDVDPGLRGYKDINLQAMRRLAADGWLLTASCSQHVSRERFHDVVRAAAGDAGRALTVVSEWGHPPDHPVALAHPEAEYLKVLLLHGCGGRAEWCAQVSPRAAPAAIRFSWKRMYDVGLDRAGSGRASGSSSAANGS
jgi:hypothetical protein